MYYTALAVCLLSVNCAALDSFFVVNMTVIKLSVYLKQEFLIVKYICSHDGGATLKSVRKSEHNSSLILLAPGSNSSLITLTLGSHECAQ